MSFTEPVIPRPLATHHVALGCACSARIVNVAADSAPEAVQLAMLNQPVCETCKTLAARCGQSSVVRGV